METSRIGPFALEERLGESRISTVFRALHVQQRRPVALKVFPAPLVANSPAAKAALVQEIETLKSLQHPHIARCYGGLLEEGHGCIAWELVEGETLGAALARRGKFSWETVVDFARQISSALECAHAAGVVHQDLIPSKILVGPDGKLKLLDFRCDRATNPTCASSQRRTVERVKYQSPEQLRGETTLTHKTDLYSLGCIMFEMLVGQPPFSGKSVAELLAAREAKAPRVDSLVMDCPVWLDSLIGQMLEPDATRRPYSAQAVTLALEETHRKIAAGTSVLEHAAGGFSTLQRTADQKAARELMKKARREASRGKNAAGEEQTDFWERPWFLALCLLLLVGSVGGYLLWPVSEESLFHAARELMATQDEYQWEVARERYLEPLLEKFPNGVHAAEAQDYIDQIDMARAEKRLQLNQRFRREPASEGERLYAEALSFEQFGDRITALEKYDSMLSVLKEQADDRPFLNLAARQKAAIEKSGAAGDRATFIEEQLQRAEKLADEGKRIDAREIWRSIINLYGDKREFAPLVTRAESRLEGKPEAAADEPTPEKSPLEKSPPDKKG